MDEGFQRIWGETYWGDEDSRSGGCSNLTQTAVLRPALSHLLRDLAIQSMLDLPCGDFHWMKEVSFPVGMHYTGGDIVPELAMTNQNQFGSSAVSFKQINLVGDELPCAEFVFCRDCLVHLNYSSIERALANVRRSGARYLLTTHFPAGRRNRDIPTGQWRPLDWTKGPFYFPKPEVVIEENCTENRGIFRDKSMALWRVADLPVHPFTR